MRFTVTGRGARRAVDVECNVRLSEGELARVATAVGCRAHAPTGAAAAPASYRFADVPLPDIGALVAELLHVERRVRRSRRRGFEPAWAEEYAESLALLRT